MRVLARQWHQLVWSLGASEPNEDRQKPYDAAVSEARGVKGIHLSHYQWKEGSTCQRCCGATESINSITPRFCSASCEQGDTDDRRRSQSGRTGWRTQHLPHKHHAYAPGSFPIHLYSLLFLYPFHPHLFSHQSPSPAAEMHLTLSFSSTTLTATLWEDLVPRHSLAVPFRPLPTVCSAHPYRSLTSAAHINETSLRCARFAFTCCFH